MNAERLIAIYDRVADAPDAVSQMRRFILDLVVRGKLVEQDPLEGQGDDLIPQIRNAWKTLASEGVLRKVRKWPAASDKDLPFDIPQNWGVVHLGEAMHLINGRAFKPSDWTPQGIPIVRIQNLNNLSAPFNRFDGEVKQKFLIDTGDFLISWSGTPGTSFGAHIWDRGPAILNQHIFKAILLGRAFNKAFLKVAINSRLLELIEQAHGGVGLQHITKPKLESVVLTLPPFPEQCRIVAKFDELMYLCDQLEKTRNEREQTRDRLTKSSYARLTTSDTDETFQVSARFVANALPALTARADQIKQLRQTILDLAVRGKLVERDPNDEPASELLKRIEEEKIRLVKAGMTRKGKKPPPVEDSPTQLPNSWCWTQIAEVGLISPRNDFPDDHIASFVPMSLIPAEYGTFNSHEMRQWGDIKKGYTHFAEGDVGLAKITPCFENGKSVVFRNLAGGIGSGTTELHVVRPIFVDADYIVIFLKSPHFIENGILKMTGTAGQKRVSREYFANSPFPLPPLPEQRRIVAKVDELMLLCDQLEANLSAGDNGRNSLLESLLRDVLYPVVNKPNAVLPSILPIGESHF